MFEFLRRAFTKKESRQLSKALWSLEQALFALSKQDNLTIGNSVENILSVGGIGSGKSSGSGRTLAHSYLRAGYGLLVLCAKRDEPALWRQYCAQTGRLTDLIEFGPGFPWLFDPFAFEQSRDGAGAGLTENLVQLFSMLIDLAEKDNGRGGKEGEAYWRKALLQFLRNLVDLVVLGTGKISIPDLYQTAVSIAKSPEEVRSEEWRAKSFCFRLLKAADQRPKTPSQQHDLGLVADYFLVELADLSDKTRSVILSTFTSMCDSLNRGVLRELFSSGSNIDPTAIERGKIIVVSMPLSEYGPVGRYGAALWKFAFQKSIERRDVSKSPRPVALWMDEGQLFLDPTHDFLFTSTSRSARVSNVLITQSISSVMAILGGGPSGKAEADAYLSNYGTKIFHSNTDPVSNEYAATLIGRCKQFVLSANNSYASNGGLSENLGQRRSGGSSGVSQIFEYEVQPREFSRLRTGGTVNRGQVDVIIFKNGNAFNSTKRNWMKTTFTQQL